MADPVTPFQTPVGRSRGLRISEFPGFPGGMNTAFPSHEIDDDFARYLQDIFVHQEGLTIRRGPIIPAVGVATLSDKGSGLVQATDPAGTYRLAVLHGSGSVAKLGIFSADFTTIAADLTIPGTLPDSPYYIVDAKPALGGGTLIGISSQYEANAVSQSLIYWRGGANANYTTGTVTVTQGAKTVTGAGTNFSNNVSPGMFLFNSSSQLVGTVQSVDSATQLTLMEGALYALSAATYTLQSLRGVVPRLSVGTITASTSSTTVTGANTKFRDQGVATNYRLYRAVDNLFLGTISAVTNDISLTLTANSAAAMQSDAYFILNNAADYTQSIQGHTAKPGFLNATHNEMQWYANLARPANEGGEHTVRVWFSGSEYSNFESLDLTAVDGDYIPINSTSGVNTPIRAIVPAHNSLFVLKDDEAFAIYGSDESNFSVRKIGDNGTLSGMSAVSYEGGVIYAAKDGVFLFDGVETESLTEDRLGDEYKNALRLFNAQTHRAWAFVHRDHYFLHIEAVSPEISPIKGNAAGTVTRWTIAIYIPTRAVSLFTNMNIRGAAATTQAQDTWFLINTSTAGRIISTNTIFDLDGNDTVACDGGALGPDFYLESKKYSAENGLIKKLWKQLMMHYLVGGDSLRLDTVLGLNTIGQTSSSTWPETVYWWDKLPPLFPTWDSLVATYPTWDSMTDSVFFTRRIKFLKRNQYLAFRIYQNSTDVTKVKLGPIALGFKFQRPGRI